MDVVVDLSFRDSDLFRDGGLGRPGHLHLEDLGASVLRRQSLAVIQSHDLVTSQKSIRMEYWEPPLVIFLIYPGYSSISFLMTSSSMFWVR